MKTKSIVYNSFVPQVESIPVIKQNESPTFKYTGYKPRYKWSDDSNTEATATTETTVSNSEDTSTSESSTSQITFQDPSSIDWSKIAGYENTPIVTQPVQSSTSIDTQSGTRPRGKHVFKDPSIQVGEMQGLLDAFADAGISLRIISGTRPGATTKQGNQSWHSQGRALDVTPVAGQTQKDFEDLAEAIRNSPDLVAYMKEHGYGIYDETSSDTLSKTGGTGAHWHIGPDKVAITGLETILKGKQGLKIPILFAKEGTKTQRYGTRKEQRRNDRVTKMISREINKKNQNISPITGLRYEEPLQPLGQEIVSFLPGVGDVIEAGNIVNDVKNKNYLPAILGTTLFLLPGNIPQIFRKAHPSQNFKEIKTYLINRLDPETLSRLNIPETINERHIKDILNDISIEIGDASHKGGALYDAEKNKIVIDKNLPIDIYGEAIDHELLHALDYLSKNNIQRYSGDVPIILGSRKLYQKTINDDNIYTSELAAKLVQLKNKTGLSKNQNLTGSQWKELVQNYSSDPKYNGISQLLNQVKDWDALAKWARKAVPVTIAFPTIPNFVNNGNDKEEMSSGNET